MIILDKGKGLVNKEFIYFEWYGKWRMKCLIVIVLRKCLFIFIDVCKYSIINLLDYFN